MGSEFESEDGSEEEDDDDDGLLDGDRSEDEYSEEAGSGQESEGGCIRHM